MNKISVVFFIVLLVACNSNKKASATADTSPSETQLSSVKARYPETTMDQLKTGHSLYFGACTKCHGAKNIDSESEQDWVKILDKMAPKAKLTATEKDAVFKYVMAVKIASSRK